MEDDTSLPSRLGSGIQKRRMESVEESNEEPNPTALFRKITFIPKIPVVEGQSTSTREKITLSVDTRPVSNTFKKASETKRDILRISKVAQISEESFPIDGDGKNIEDYIIDYINFVIQKYYKRVSYVQESWLHLILILPFVILCVAIPLLTNNVIFATKAIALGSKVAIVLLGILAAHMIEIINHRHANLSTMAKIINGEATVRTICDHIKGKAQSGLLFWSAVIFYAVLIAGELSITNIPANSFYAFGTASQLDVSNMATPSENSSSIFRTAVGAQFGCHNCVGLRTQNLLLIPLSVVLVSSGGVANNLDVIHKTVQDIISLDVECFTILPTIVPRNRTLQVALGATILGEGAASFDFEFSAPMQANGLLKSKRCSIVARDLSGIASVRYNLGVDGVSTRKQIDTITTRFPSNCTLAGDYCLNFSSIPNLSVKVMSVAFAGGLVSIDQAYSFSMDLIPDASAEMSDSQFSIRAAEVIGMNLLIAASKFNYISVPAVIMSDGSAVQLNIQTWLLALTLANAVFCPLLAFVLLMIDILTIRKINNVLLRRLSQSIKPGQKHVSELAEYVSQIFDQFNPDWDLAVARFGEDRRTTSDAQGKLRFGSKKDVVRFKPRRLYY